MHWVRFQLCAGWGRSFNFSFWIISIAAGVWGRALSWCKTAPFVTIPLHLLWIVGFYSLNVTQHHALVTIFPQSQYCLRMCTLKSQTVVNSILRAEGTLLNFLVLSDDVCFQSMLWFCLLVNNGTSIFDWLWQSIAGQPVHLHGIIAKIAFMFQHIPICAHLQAALVPTLHKFCDTWGPCFWNMQIHSWCPICWLCQWQ